MLYAKPVQDAVRVDEFQPAAKPWGDAWLYTYVAADDYDAYNALPVAVEFQGRTYGKAGWNSDTGHVAYSTSRPVAVKAK